MTTRNRGPPTRVIIPNLDVLGQTVWTQREVTEIGDSGPTLWEVVRGFPLETRLYTTRVSYQTWSL